MNEPDVDDFDTMHPLNCTCQDCLDMLICELYEEPAA